MCLRAFLNDHRIYKKRDYFECTLKTLQDIFNNKCNDLCSKNNESESEPE